MTLQAVPPITIGHVATEIGASLPLSLGDSRVRALAAIPSGPISLGNLLGKSAYTPMTVTRVDDADSMASNAIGSTYIGHAAPSVTVSGGSGGYTYLWAITAGSGFTLTLSTSRICDVAHSIPAAGFSGTCTLSCAVTDNTSHTVTQTGILAVYAA